MPNVHILGSYSWQQPLHGGQIRLAEVVRAYQRSGASVSSASVIDEAGYQGPRGASDIGYPASSPFRTWRGRAIPLIDDLTAGHYAAEDERAYRALTQSLPQPLQLLHLEQPWLLPLVQRWQTEGLLQGTHIVYGSQNLEAPLKTAILKQYHVPDIQPVIDAITQLERTACQMAHTILAVSRADQVALQALAGKPVRLACNGIAAWQAHTSDLEAWRKKLPAVPFALFVGSAHPPNISGFFDMCGSALGFIPPDTRLVVAGSVGPQLQLQPQYHRWLPLNDSRIQVLGLVDDAALAAVKTLAHTFILPITEGGGSNIKTAEALYSGSHVVATPTSFRGFDDYAQLPGVSLHAERAAFCQAITASLQTPPPASDETHAKMRATLLWEHTLADLPALVRPAL